LELIIEKLVYGGDGLARLPADESGRRKAVFLPFVLEGERVQARLSDDKAAFARGEVEQIVAASPARIAPDCPYFQRCGGCHYQHTSYQHQLEIKSAILHETLTRIGKLDLKAEIQIHPSPPWNYRNRTRMRLRTHPEFSLGYYRFASHALLPVETCPISSPLINRAIAALWELGRAGNFCKSITEIEFFANSDDTHLQLELYSSVHGDDGQLQAFGETLRAAIPEIVSIAVFPQSELGSIRPTSKLEAVPEILTGPGTLLYKANSAEYRVGAGSFFQVNRHLRDELVGLVVDGRSGTTALDLYAGVGLFSVVLARKFERVIAVESSQTSYSDLKYNRPENVKAVHATTEHYLKNGGKIRADLVVVDPPRSGLREDVARMLAQLKAPRITYVSCDPATLARDLRVLVESGYRVNEAHLIDLFPQTYHLETVIHLTL